MPSRVYSIIYILLVDIRTCLEAVWVIYSLKIDKPKLTCSVYCFLLLGQFLAYIQCPALLFFAAHLIITWRIQSFPREGGIRSTADRYWKYKSRIKLPKVTSENYPARGKYWPRKLQTKYTKHVETAMQCISSIVSNR